MTVSDFQILIKSSPKGEVVHETKFSLKISYSTHACLAQLDQHQTCKPVMVSVVRGNIIFLRHLDANNNNNNNNSLFSGWFTCVMMVLLLSFLVQFKASGKGLSRGRVLFTLVMDNRTKCSNIRKKIKLI